MKKLHLFAFVLVLLSACSSVKQIGQVNMISTRNIDTSADYELLSAYVGGRKSELRNNKSNTIDEAVNKVVKNVPGGEYLMNVKIYRVGDSRFAVEGDVWGLSDNQSRYGFRVGESVVWRTRFDNYEQGAIVSFIDTEKCYVKTKEGKLIKKKYSDLIHSQEPTELGEE
jgi:hypothetical protein